MEQFATKTLQAKQAQAATIFADQVLRGRLEIVGVNRYKIEPKAQLGQVH